MAKTTGILRREAPPVPGEEQHGEQCDTHS